MQPMNVVSPHGAAFGPWSGGKVDPEGPRVQSQAIWDIQGGPLGGTELASCLCHEFSLTTAGQSWARRPLSTYPSL